MQQQRMEHSQPVQQQKPIMQPQQPILNQRSMDPMQTEPRQQVPRQMQNIPEQNNLKDRMQDQQQNGQQNQKREMNNGRR